MARISLSQAISRFSLTVTVWRRMREVAVGDMAAVLAEVDGDAVGPAQFGQGGRPDGVRLVGPAGLPNGGHVIDVDAKLRHGGDYSSPRAA